MTCPSCGARLADGTRFCIGCGVRFVADAIDARPAETASELLEGTSMRDICAQAPLFWRRAVEMIEHIGVAVAEARVRGIDNPDLTPDAIYVDHQPGSPWRVKLVEVSVEAMRGDEPRDTASGGFRQRTDKFGRPIPNLEYLSPEQLMGKPMDARSSVYSLGTITYELLTGRRPFHDAKGPAGLVTAMLKSTPAPPSTIERDIPPEVDAIVLKCLAKAASDRYESVDDLAELIRDTLGR